MPDAEVAHEGYPHANAKPREPDTQAPALQRTGLPKAWSPPTGFGNEPGHS